VSYQASNRRANAARLATSAASAGERGIVESTDLGMGRRL
jgi:hypothetical protein